MQAHACVLPRECDYFTPGEVNLQMKQAPNFLLAAPVLGIALYGCAAFVREHFARLARRCVALCPLAVALRAHHDGNLSVNMIYRYIYVCMYVSIYVSMHVSMEICMYACRYGS